MKKNLFLSFLLLLAMFLFPSCEKERESDKLFDSLAVVSVYPSNGDTVDTYLFNEVYVVFNHEISYRETLDKLSHSIRVYNKTTKKDITDKIYITNSLKLDGRKVNIKQLFTFLPDCEYEVDIDLPRGKYTFHFYTKSPKL